MLRDVGDAILRAEKLEEELKKAKQQASNLQIRLDRNAVEYRNEVQVLTAAKDGLVDQNKSLTAQKNELVEKNKKLRQKETGKCLALKFPRVLITQSGILTCFPWSTCRIEKFRGAAQRRSHQLEGRLLPGKGSSRTA